MGRRTALSSAMICFMPLPLCHTRGAPPRTAQGELSPANDILASVLATSVFYGFGLLGRRLQPLPQRDSSPMRREGEGEQQTISAGVARAWRVALLLTALAVAAGAADGNAIVFSCDFESSQWYREWGLEKPEADTDVVADDTALKFQAHRGKALRVRIPAGGNLGSNLRYVFARRTGSEPEEIYFRYYLRLADDWDAEVQGGKLPGISGTYGRAGWGGRPVNGKDGWSARGLFLRKQDGRTPIGYYVYHVEMKGKYGSHWAWDKDGLGHLENNRWYAIEQYVKLNTPGKNDGVMRAWVDGKLAFEKTDVRMRDVPELRIELVWLNVYQGGTKPAASDEHVFIDDVVIARQYIGPAK
jgi:hypothetical protein